MLRIQHLFRITLSTICFIALVGALRAQTLDRHKQVAMRMVGHEVLLQLGDSSSRVLPIELRDSTYVISFESELSFEPSELVDLVDSVMQLSGIADPYILEVIGCDSGQVEYAYEINGREESIVPCLGRPLPLACYQLAITLGDEQQGEAYFLAQSEPPEPSEGTSLWVVLLGGAIVIYILFLISRRRRSNSEAVLEVGSYRFDPKKMELSMGREKMELTSKEAELLRVLLKSVNETVTREEILKEVWGNEGDYIGRTLDVFISKLRKRFEADDSVRIVNIRGIGYRLVLG